jgi:hypothetical protein
MVREDAAEDLVGRTTWIALAMLAGLVLACGGTASSEERSAQEGLSADSRSGESPQKPTVTVFASGLNNPRGLKFGPDGALYVAEGGVGGTNPAAPTQDCTVLPPIGPYTGSDVGSRISRIDHHGVRTTVVDNLPSSQTSDMSGDLVSGVADVAFIDGRMYAILAGAGCSHGVPGIPNGVIRIHHDGSWALVTDLGAFQRAHPVADPNPGDFDPDGTWYSMIAVHDALYAVEPNHGEIARIDTGGHVSRVLDVSAALGHVVPTVLASHEGNFYFSNLGVFPQGAGTSKVWKLTDRGHLGVAASGFNMVLGLTFDWRGRMYVLQSSQAPAPTPGTGSVIRVDEDGSQHTLVSGLSVPSGMTFGPDGDLYISNLGFGPPPVGLGQILRVRLPRERHGGGRDHDDD